MATYAQEDPGEGVRAEKAAGRTIVVTRHCPLEMRSRSSWSVDQFVFVKKLGGGYASTVHLAIDKTTGIQVALKMYHRCKLSQLNNYQVQREIRIHSALAHTYILELYAAFQDEAGVYLVTEYASKGDVFGELDRRGGSMTEGDAVRQVMLPFLGALEYLHLLHIIHRDIKPENLLFTAAGALKVADFGLSIDITQERPVTRVGTLDYMAPEVVVCPDKCRPSDNKELTHLHYTFLVDSWAVGVLAYELTVGRAPFDGGNKQKTIEQILHAQPKYPSWISEPARHFMAWCLTKDPTKRPTIQQLAMHPWITSHQQTVKPKINPGRAQSFHDLKHFMAPTAAQTAAHPHHTLKFGGMCAPLTELPESDAGVTPGDAGCAPGQISTASLTAGSSSSSSSSHATSSGATIAALAATSAVNSPFAAVAATAAPAAEGAAAGGLPPVPGGVPPKPKAPAATGGFFGLTAGAAAEKLRAFVSRCQSANNLDGLRAALSSMPPEPSNACFEPGGRFYKAPAAGPPAAGGLTAPPPVAAAPGEQHQQQQQLGGVAGAGAAAAGTPATAAAHGSLHDSSSSWSTHSSKEGAAAAAGGGVVGLAAADSLQVQQQHPVAAPVGMPHSDSCKSLLDCIQEEVPSSTVLGSTPQLLPMLPGTGLACTTTPVESGSPVLKSPGGVTASPVSLVSVGSQLSSAGSSTATYNSGSGSVNGGDDHKERVAGGSSSSCSSPWTPVLQLQHQKQQQQQPGAVVAVLHSPMSAPQPPSPPSLASSTASNAFLSASLMSPQGHVSQSDSYAVKGVTRGAFDFDLAADSRAAASFPSNLFGSNMAAAPHQQQQPHLEDPAATYLEDAAGQALNSLQCFSFLRVSPR